MKKFSVKSWLSLECSAPVRGGQCVQLPDVRQQVRPRAAHGQCALRRAAGPWWGVGVAFVASLLRNILGLGSLMASRAACLVPALRPGLRKDQKPDRHPGGRGVRHQHSGRLCAYPVAICLMGKSAGDIAFYAYIVPFLISTAVGAVIAGVLVYSLQHSGALRSMQSSLS